MKSKSLRLRLALWSVLLAGVALASFAAIAWWQLRDAKIEALDRQILDQSERELSRHWPEDHWKHHEHNMGRLLGAHDIHQTLLIMQDDNGLVYRSSHWPESLNPDQLPWPQLEDRPTPENATDSMSSDGANPPPVGREDPEFSFPPPMRTGHPPPLFPPEDFPPPPGEPPRLHLPAFTKLSLDVGGHLWRFGLTTAPHGKLAIGIDLTVVEGDMTELRNAFLLATPLALGFIALSAWFLSGLALSPIRHLTNTMERVTAKGLDKRIAVGKEDQEFLQLIQVFNNMLERLERSFLQASRFSGDAAHELKTPLAILQGQIERAMAQCEVGSPIQASLTGILDEVQRLGTISRKLLLLSLADAGRLHLYMSDINLTQALEDLLEDAQMLAPELDVSGSIAFGLTVKADAELFRQVLHNLLSNAIKYNLPKGWIHINAARQDGRIEVSVANASLGIPDADRERIFERFYRADQSHNRQIEGVGLGLSLSREIARAHGGDLLLTEAEIGKVRFDVYLPT